MATARAIGWIDRAGMRAGRVTALLSLGCLASGVVSGSALAPVAQAHASVQDGLRQAEPAYLKMDEGTAVSPFAPAIVVGLDPPAVSALEERSREVETFLRFGSRELPRRLVDTVVRAATEAGVDPVYLMALADTESSFRSDVKASTSSAEGLFQFIDRTWLETVKGAGARCGLSAEADAIEIVDEKPVVDDVAVRARILDLRRDPYVAALMAAELLKRDAAQIGFRIGRGLNRTEMYLAHFLGLEDAAKFLSLMGRKRAPSAPQAFPAAARANHAIFFAKAGSGTVKARHKRARSRGLSLSEVYARIDRLILPKVERYRNVVASVQTAQAGG